jgi:hypothetical protein
MSVKDLFTLQSFAIVYVRMFPNEEGSTTIWTFMRPDGLTDEQFQEQPKGFDITQRRRRLLRKNEQEDVRHVAERYIAKSDPFIVMVTTPGSMLGLQNRIKLLLLRLEFSI